MSNPSDFVITAKNTNTLRRKSQKLQDLRLETMHLEIQNQEMEQKLNQLRVNMDKEKEERQFSNGFRWKSGQVGSLTQPSPGPNQSKQNSLMALQSSTGKIHLKLLKDYIAEPSPQPVQKASCIASVEKPKIKGKACGQCESKNALLTCLECAEDYCVSCFTKFHQKGALKIHRTCPVQGKFVPFGKIDVVQQFKRDIDVGHVKPDTKKETHRSMAFKNISAPEKSHSVESVTVPTSPEKGSGGSLLLGAYNEDVSSKSFQEILMEWRNSNPDYRSKVKKSEIKPESVGESEVQTLVTYVNKQVEIEFTQNSLNYMEKLLLKKHRRTPVDPVAGVQLSNFRHSGTFLDGSQHSLNEEDNSLTADELEDHENYVALFNTQSPGVDPERSESSLKFVELNEDCEEGLEESSDFVVYEVDSNDSHIDHSVPVDGRQKKALIFREKSDSSSVPAAEATSNPAIHSKFSIDKHNVSNPNDGKKKRNPSTEMYKSESAARMTLLAPEATRTSPRGATGNSPSKSAECSPRGGALAQHEHAQRGKGQLPAPDTSPSSFTNRTGLLESAAGSSAMEVANVLSQGRTSVSTYRGLEGFFVLGIDPKEVPQESRVPRKSEQRPVENAILCGGDGNWRPDSSLSKFADDRLVKSVVEDAWSRPTSRSGQLNLSARVESAASTPHSSRGYKLQRSISANTPRHIVSRPASAASRPLSRAASEILEIESIDITEQDDLRLEDDAEQQALTVLEKELMELKTHSHPQTDLQNVTSKELNFNKNSKRGSMIHSDSKKMQVTANVTKVAVQKEVTELGPSATTSVTFEGEYETDDDDEEQSRQDKENVMLLC